MGAPITGPAGVTVTTPSARDTLSKVGKIVAADGSTAFQAFVLPKGAVVIGVYTISAGANTTQTINAGFSAGGTELLNAFAPNSTGYAVSGAATGSAVGVKLTEDEVVFLKASAALTNSVIVKVEYTIPPQGLSL